MKNVNEYVFENFDIKHLSNTFIFRHSAGPIAINGNDYFSIQPQDIEINYAAFTKSSGQNIFPTVTIKQKENDLILSCNCISPKKKLCEHQVQVIFNIMDRKELRIFFDKDLRLAEIKTIAKDYGLANEDNVADFFQVSYNNKSFNITPKLKGLIPINTASNNYFQQQLIGTKKQLIDIESALLNAKTIIVLSQHKFYKHLSILLFAAATTKDGKIKNPLTDIDPTPLLWQPGTVEEIKFYAGIARFKDNYTADATATDLEGIKAVIKNPLGLDVFYHNSSVHENINASSLVSVQLRTLDISVVLTVYQRDKFYEISGQLVVNQIPYELNQLKIFLDYFILLDGTMHLIDNPDFLRVMDFFKQHYHKIIIHQSKYEVFQRDVLSKLEHNIKISYTYLKSATQAQLEESGFLNDKEKIIYLSSSDNYIFISPVIKYGNVEIPTLSKKQIYSIDQDGNAFTIDRDEAAENKFISILIRQHIDFYEQTGKDFFYLHKKRFMEDEWFLHAFDEWQRENITVLGFNEVINNKINPHKPKVFISVGTGTDWFDTSVEVKYGNQKVALKQLYQSIRNKNRYVKLGDGTQGILPIEWIEKFSRYFEAGEILEEKIKTPKINFSSIKDLYETDMLSEAVQNELLDYEHKISNFNSIEKIPVPSELSASLREYQKEGLNWLNFLDQFNFGGCLADDMGLGKTIQVIAFILSQRNKNNINTNLVVVPTSLIFNWQAEVEKFAPSIKIYTYYGNNKTKEISIFNSHEIVLTTYGTMVAEIRYLKKYTFNYIFLDESQAIKNPSSQRYQAARLLQSRNKICLTGTPMENSTLDLYGQLSFACPGLLGNLRNFKDIYYVPIDKFGDSSRAIELRKKTNPFILRRTKLQVAQELPDKTETIFYCEMGLEQRRIYDSYKKEFQNFILAKPEEDIPQHTMHILQGLTKLRQICNAPALLKDEAYLGESSAKIEVLLEEIKVKSPEHKILVFSQFVGMLNLISHALKNNGIPFEMLTGQTKDRAAKVDAFQNNENVRVFLISLKAGGTGLNLTGADYVYLVDPWWNPAVENQAIDRCYRIGQHKNVIAVRLICPDTIEDKIVKLQSSKNVLINNLIKTDTGALKSLSKKDLLDLFN